MTFNQRAAYKKNNSSADFTKDPSVASFMEAAVELSMTRNDYILQNVSSASATVKENEFKVWIIDKYEDFEDIVIMDRTIDLADYKIKKM